MTSKPKMSAPAAAVEILKAECGPLHIKMITERVLDRFDTGLKGKTPQATLGAKLHTSAKKGETFRKVGPGTFELIGHGASGSASVSLPNTGDVLAADMPPVAVRGGDAPQARPDPKSRPAVAARRHTAKAKAPVAV